MSIEQSVRRWDAITEMPRRRGRWREAELKAAVSKEESTAPPRSARAHVYFPAPMLTEIVRDAHRHDRSLSESLCEAWKLARATIFSYPESPK